MRGKMTALPPPAAAAPAAGTDHTAGLSDRSLAAILLRLPSPATLARAGSVSRRWRRVASSPAFLRLFRRIHPPPLLGFFLCNGGFTVERVNGVLVGEVLSPTFFISNPAPPGLSGAVSRCVNFSLESLPNIEHWALADTRDGLLLLCDSFSAHDRLRVPRRFVVSDPVTGRSVLVRDAPIYEVDGESAYLGAALLLTDGDGGGGRLSFEVIVVTYFMWGPRLLVFSSLSGAWTVHPYANVGGSSRIMPMLGSVGYDMHANGCVYWLIDDEQETNDYLLVLDTGTKVFTTIKLLSGMRTRHEGNMRVVRTDSGELRLVALAGMVLDSWRLDRSRSSRGRWVREAGRELAYADGAMALFAEIGGCRTVIMDAGDGFVFFKHFGSPWVFVLDLDAMVLTPLPHREKYYFGPALPYRMALHPPFPVLDSSSSNINLDELEQC
ncbi:unnamed protein product [Urochloa decumbens]|uniref:F-box domain-containing protein n=1 Tax=Urochloa decumbens TaxID=240449 RepID=A0ABC9BRT7_9POAL